jgi:GntR family transcriptional regulator/MocR family aminotransferase
MTRLRRASAVFVRLDKRSGTPLHRQIYDGVRGAILSGALAPGVGLPSTRGFAKDLGVSRTTVLLAFGLLRAEGYIMATEASGTFVARELPDALLVAARPPKAESGYRHPSLSSRGAAIVASPRWLPHHRTPQGPFRVGVPQAPRIAPAPRPFRIGTPATDLFPVTTWARIAARHLRRITTVMLDYGEPGGHRPLREAIAAHVGVSRGMHCQADQVILTAGATQGLDFAARMLLDPGDAAWLEEPGYLGARSALVAAGARIVPVPVDAEGLDVAAGSRRAPRARMAYVSPSHQYPLGMALSLERRLALLQWARRATAWILEDDYDSEYRYVGHPLTALHGLDPDGRVIYVGTFSKTLFPALRLGFLIVPADLVDRFLMARAVADQHPPALEQAIVTDFIAEGHFSRHLRRMRGIYQERLEALLESARRHAAGALTIRSAGSGLQVVAELPPGTDDVAVSAAAAAQDIEASPLSLYYMGEPRASGLLLGFASVDGERIEQGMRRLVAAIASARRG